jgi:hypothetical protein
MRLIHGKVSLYFENNPVLLTDDRSNLWYTILLCVV